MVVLPDKPGVVSSTLIGLNQGTPWNNKIHVSYTGGAPTSSDLFALNTGLQAAWVANFAPLCQAAVTLNSIISLDLTNRTSATATSTFTTPSAGTRAGTAMPSQVACVISWHVNFRYRGGHCRTYLPAGVLADVTSGHLWTSAFILAANNAATGFLGDVADITSTSHDFALIMLSYYFKPPGGTAGTLRTVPEAFPVESGHVRSRVDTQRRRLGKETV